MDVAKAAVDAAPKTEKVDVVTAAVGALTAAERTELMKTIWPTGSADRRWVFIAGFAIAGAVAVGLGAIAWGAQGGENSIAASLVVLATGFASAELAPFPLTPDG